MKILSFIIRPFASRMAKAVVLSLLAASPAVANESSSTGLKRLSLLIDSAAYAAEDKEALMAGLVAAYDSDGQGVSMKTIEGQVKKTSWDLPASITFLFEVTRCLDQHNLEVMNNPTLTQANGADGARGAGHLQDMVAEYTANTLEALFKHHDRNVIIPDSVTPSVTNPEYRQLLTLTARTFQRSNPQSKDDFRAPSHHTVKAGDSIAVIARKYHLSPGALMAANPGLKPGQIRVGHVVYIPSSATQSTVLHAEAPQRQAAR